MVPSSVCDSAVSPCLQVSWLSFISISHCTLLSQVPSHHLPSVNSRPCPGTAFQSLFQLQAAALSRGLASLSGVCVARIVCVMLIPFRLTQFSCFFLQQPQCFTSVTNISLPCSSVPASVPQPQVQIQFFSLFSFCPPSFVLLSVAWFYISFSGGQVLSWCSARSSVSGGVFLTYPWREMYSVRNYSSSIVDLIVWYRAHTSLQVRLAVGGCPISVVVLR